MNMKIVICLLASLLVFSTSPFNPDIAEAKGKKPITRGITKLVRGSNTNPCTAQAIGSGNVPPVGPTEDLTNLSVSCSEDKDVTYKELWDVLPQQHACGTTLADLRKERPDVTIVSDPTGANPYHCILDNITPREFVRAIKWQR
jgi:hypothetical protein